MDMLCKESNWRRYITQKHALTDSCIKIAILINRKGSRIPSTTKIGVSACSCLCPRISQLCLICRTSPKKNPMNHEIKSNKAIKPRKPKNKIKLTRKNKTFVYKCYLNCCNISLKSPTTFYQKKKSPYKNSHQQKKYLLQQSPLSTATTKVQKKEKMRSI